MWNASASVPTGLYLRVAGAPATGDLVLVAPPATVAHLAAERGYLPPNVPLIKRIAASEGDRVCVVGETIWINGEHRADSLLVDSQSRPLPHWTGCRELEKGEVFLLTEAAASFDSRYFGPVMASDLRGRLIPLWID